MRALILVAIQVIAAQAAMTPSSLELLNCRPATTTPMFRLGFDLSEGPGVGPAGSASVTANNHPVDVMDVRLSGNTLLVTVAAPYDDPGYMQGRTLDFDVVWTQPGGQTQRSKLLARWNGGDMAMVHNDACVTGETRNAPNTWSSTPVWRPVLVFLGFAGLWLFAAFAVPRLAWPPEEETIRPLRRGSG